MREEAERKRAEYAEAQLVTTTLQRDQLSRILGRILGRLGVPAGEPALEGA